MALGRVATHANDQGVVSLHGFVVVAETAGLSRAAAREVSGVEVENDVLVAAQVGETEGSAVLQHRLKVGRGNVRLEHSGLLTSSIGSRLQTQAGWRGAMVAHPASRVSSSQAGSLRDSTP